jgi:hypothetical protein
MIPNLPTIIIHRFYVYDQQQKLAVAVSVRSDAVRAICAEKANFDFFFLLAPLSYVKAALYPR